MPCGKWRVNSGNGSPRGRMTLHIIHNWQALCAVLFMLHGLHEKFIALDFCIVYREMWCYEGRDMWTLIHSFMHLQTRTCRQRGYIALSVLDMIQYRTHYYICILSCSGKGKEQLILRCLWARHLNPNGPSEAAQWQTAEDCSCTRQVPGGNYCMACYYVRVKQGTKNVYSVTWLNKSESWLKIDRYIDRQTDRLLTLREIAEWYCCSLIFFFFFT